VNVGDNTSSCNGDVVEQLVQLLVVTNGKLNVAWDDADLLVVT